MQAEFKNYKHIFLGLIFTLFTFLTSTVSSHAFRLSDKAEISIITCDGGNGAATAYGHTAIRVVDSNYNYDLVFNYGIYDFEAPNFLYRFASGQTDYKLEAYKFESFLSGYKHYKRSVYEQVLNLSSDEKQKVIDFLIWNAKEENKVYRYNFFFDNCATRVRDVVVNNIEGGISFNENLHAHKTLRQLVEEYHGKLLWLTFGIDLAVSSKSDREASLWEEMLLPNYLMSHFAEATKTAENVPIIKSSKVLYQAPEEEYKSYRAFGPFMVLLLVAVLVFVVSFKQYKKGKMRIGLDFIVFGITGLMGLVLSWLAIYSEHPAMSPNNNLLWAIPLNLLFAFAFTVKKWRPTLRYYFVMVTVWLLLFVCCSAFIPQKFHPAFYLIIAMVLSRSLFQSLLILQEQKRKK